MILKDKLRWYLRQEFADNGITWYQATTGDKNDERLLRVVGKLLIEYPVTFHIDFIVDELGLSVSRSHYALKAKEAYLRSKQKRA